VGPVNADVDAVEVVSGELVKVMISKGKEGEKAISVPWRHWKAGLYSNITASNIGPRLRQYISALAIDVKYWRAIITHSPLYIHNMRISGWGL
jgi:hypothetical protein